MAKSKKPSQSSSAIDDSNADLAVASSRSHVYVFGSGDCGQLALGDEVFSSKKPKLHPFFESCRCTAVAAGGMHSLALDASGQRVYTWGCNDEKALGHSAPEFAVGSVEGFPADIGKIIQVAGGDSISAALTDKSEIFTWGTFRDSKGVLGHDVKSAGLLQEHPTLLKALQGLQLSHVAAGSNHLMAITVDGQLFAWGSGEQGQLGRRILERHKLLALRPTNVTPRYRGARVAVKRVVCGSYHTLMIAEVSGVGVCVFVAGLNNFGQLGLGHHEDCLTAEMIDPQRWAGGIPIEAAAGEHHSLVLCDNGQVFAFGRADYGQLGQGDFAERASNLPLPVASIAEPIKMIAAGGHHNLAVGQSGKVYSWGYGEMHQLGHGPDEIESAPRAINTSLAGNVVQVAAGGQHSIILTKE